jgi:hypothetical protein
MTLAHRSLVRLLLTLAAAALTSVAAPDARAEDKPAVKAITWADLRFTVAPPKKVEIEGVKHAVETFNDQIPDKVRELDNTLIELRGYMMPTELEGKNVRSFVLVVSQNVCCYGATPDINEYIVVRMTGKPALLLENMPIRVIGKLHVGDIYENGYWTGIYALECTEVKL